MLCLVVAERTKAGDWCPSKMSYAGPTLSSYFSCNMYSQKYCFRLYRCVILYCSLKDVYFCRFGYDGNASKVDVYVIRFVIGICGEGFELVSDCRQFYLFSTPRSNVLFEERTETPSDPLEESVVWSVTCG